VNLAKKILIGAAIYLMFLVALLPADIALRFAPLPSSVSVSGASGTIWFGSIESITYGKRQLEQVTWQLSPWELLLGKAKLDLVIGNRDSAVNGKGKLMITMSGIDVQDLRFEAPSRFLIGNARLPFRTKVAGNISLFVDHLEHGMPWCEQLQGKIFLDGVSVNNQFGDYPLGDIELGLSCDNGQVKIVSDESKNKLGFSGVVLLQTDKVVQLTAKIKQVVSQPKDLQQALVFLGKHDSQGYYPISYSGRISGL